MLNDFLLLSTSYIAVWAAVPLLISNVYLWAPILVAVLIIDLCFLDKFSLKNLYNYACFLHCWLAIFSIPFVLLWMISYMSLNGVLYATYSVMAFCHVFFVTGVLLMFRRGYA